MIQDFRIRRLEYGSSRPFDEIIAAFEAAVGTIEGTRFLSIAATSKDVAGFEALVLEKLGSSGFTRFFTIDHGQWPTLLSPPAKARVYTISNLLTAISILRHDVVAGLNIPVRVMIYREEACSKTFLIYDQPSTLIRGRGTKDVAAAVETLDAELASLAEQVTRAQA